MPKKSLQTQTANNQTRITFRVDLKNGKAIGPGKIRLLELISEFGSISSAGKALKMSYRRAWLLVDDLNHSFNEPLVVTKQGGKGGGCAELTRTGQNVVKCYRLMENKAKKTFAPELESLENEL